MAKEFILFPVGRLVQGSLYKPNTTDAENRPLTYKSGPNLGKPRVDYYLAVAIRKNGESHWSQTEWGAKIYNVAVSSWPNGQHNSPNFAWKILDGDSTIPNSKGRKPCENEGFAGHWILKFSGAFAPSIYSAKGTEQITEPDFVNLGDYIQMYGSVDSNDSNQQPGVYLNHSKVAFAGYGERIEMGIDAKDIGFGQSPLPLGASTVPLSQGFSPSPAVAVPAVNTMPSVAAAPLPPVIPHTAILIPPVPHVMTEKAAGLTYDSFIQNGWNDEMLISNGYMLTWKI